MDKGAFGQIHEQRQFTDNGVTRVGHDLVTKPPPETYYQNMETQFPGDLGYELPSLWGWTCTITICAKQLAICKEIKLSLVMWLNDVDTYRKMSMKKSPSDFREANVEHLIGRKLSHLNHTLVFPGEFLSSIPDIFFQHRGTGRTKPMWPLYTLFYLENHFPD